MDRGIACFSLNSKKIQRCNACANFALAFERWVTGGTAGQNATRIQWLCAAIFFAVTDLSLILKQLLLMILLQHSRWSVIFKNGRFDNIDSPVIMNSVSKAVQNSADDDS